MMRLTILTAALAACLAAAPVPVLMADPALEAELALPPLALGPGPKLDAQSLRIEAKYLDRPGDEGLRKVVREAKVLLWASSPEFPPTRMRTEVLKARSRYAIPPGLLKTRFLAPRTVPMTNAYKAALLNTNREVARLVATMEHQVEAMQALAEARDRECPRWQAHHDLLTACLLFRLAHLDEYAIQIGEMRKEFPERDPAKHNGWRLEPAEGMRDVPGKKRVKQARKLLERLVEAHPATPWAAVARHLMEIPLSASWTAE